MKTLLPFILGLLLANISFGQGVDEQTRTKVMTLGVFHFNFPNQDAVKTEEKDKISVLNEPFQSEIIAIAKAIQEFKPTIIAVERTQKHQKSIDSLYTQYRAGKWTLRKDEIYQLGFRIGNNLNIDNLVCIDDFGVNYDHIVSLFNDSASLAKITAYHEKLYEAEGKSRKADKITSIYETLLNCNNPKNIQSSMAGYLSGIFLYEEEEGDFVGVDFQSGRWFNRNLRIFRNIQRIPRTTDDRILLIIGSDHLNLLNFFFESSNEFELVSPLPYIEKARLKK
jgi:hypothetical protein